jgi:hypothetical protein
MMVRFPQAFTQRVAAGGTSGLVLDERVTSARRDILAVLASWSGLVADERGLARRPGRDAGELTAFLAVHLDWLLAHPAGASFLSELRDAAASAAAAVRGSGDGLGVELGRCVEEGCDQIMVAARGGGSSSSSGLSESSGLSVRCAAGHAWAPRQWLRLARRLEQVRS